MHSFERALCKWWCRIQNVQWIYAMLHVYKQTIHGASGYTVATAVSRYQPFQQTISTAVQFVSLQYSNWRHIYLMELNFKRIVDGKPDTTPHSVSTAQQFVSSFLTSARTGLHLHPRCTRSQQDLKLKWQRSIRISVHYPFHVWLHEVPHKVYIKEACRKAYWLQWTFNLAETLCILGECDLFLAFVRTQLSTQRLHCTVKHLSHKQDPTNPSVDCRQYSIPQGSAGDW